MCLDPDLVLKQKYKSLNKTEQNLYSKPRFLFVSPKTQAFERFAAGIFIFGQNASLPPRPPLNSLANISCMSPGETVPKVSYSSKVLSCFQFRFIRCQPAPPELC